MVNVLTVNYMQHSTRIYSLAFCVRGTRTRPLISVRSPVQLIGQIFCVDTHLPRFEELAYILPHFDAVTCLVIRSCLRKAFLII